MNENEYTTPEGVRLMAVARPDSISCDACWFRHRRNVCSRSARREAGEPMCNKFLRGDRRHIYWVVAEVEPNPL